MKPTSTENAKAAAFAAVRAAEAVEADLSRQLFEREPLSAERVVLRAELAAARAELAAAVAAWRAI